MEVSGFVASSITLVPDVRIDGRRKDQLRAFKFEGYSGSDSFTSSIWSPGSPMASSKLVLGETQVMCSVYGPALPKYQKHENFEDLTIEVELSFVGDRDVAKLERNNASFIKTVLKSCIDTRRYPRQLLLVKLDAVCSQGGVLAAAINAAVLALMDSGISLLSIPVATSLAAIYSNNMLLAAVVSNSISSSNDSDNSDNSDSILEVFVDPTFEEEKVASITGTVVTVQKSSRNSEGLRDVANSEDVLCSNFIGSGVDRGIFEEIFDKAIQSADFSRNNKDGMLKNFRNLYE